MKQQISKRALTDAMTGLESRYVYELETKPKGWLNAITDVNGLGAINKTFGQEVGNDLIARMGNVVKAKVEEAGGRAFRYGGDEIKYWFPDQASARRALTAIDRKIKEMVVKFRLPSASVVGMKGFTLSYGYGLDEIAADKALNVDKLRRQSFGERAPKGVVPKTIQHTPLQAETNRAWAAGAGIAGAAIATAARAGHSSEDKKHPQTESKYGTATRAVGPRALAASGALRADEPRLALQHMRQQLSKLGYSTAMMDQLRLSEAAQILAEDRGPEGQPGNASGGGGTPGGVGPSRRPIQPQVPLSLSQQMARLYRRTIAGDGYTRATDNDAWAMVPDNLKRALEEYWQGTPLTRAQVQRLMPVYRRYVAETGYPGDMVHWLTATLREHRYPR